MPERRREVVSREGEGPPRGEQLRRLILQVPGLIEQVFRLGVQGRVARLPHFLEIGIGQSDVRVEVFRVLLDLFLEGTDESIRRSARRLTEIEGQLDALIRGTLASQESQYRQHGEGGEQRDQGPSKPATPDCRHLPSSCVMFSRLGGEDRPPHLKGVLSRYCVSV